jgi:hypothetical protein
MGTQPPASPKKNTGRTTVLLPDVSQSAKRVSNNALRRLFRHLTGIGTEHYKKPSEALRQLTITGFILSIVSILTSIFPICGLPTAIAGLWIGIYSRQRSRALRNIATWTIALSCAGLALSLLDIIVLISIIITQRLLT